MSSLPSVCPIFRAAIMIAQTNVAQKEETINKLIRCTDICAKWNKEYQCCDEVARTIIIEKYLKEIVDKLGWLKNLSIPREH